MTDLHVRNNAELHRYELLAGSELAGFAEYNLLSKKILFTHTEILPAYEGHGYSSTLIGQAIADARTIVNEVVPVCTVVAQYLRKHPEDWDLLTPETRRAFRI